MASDALHGPPPGLQPTFGGDTKHFWVSTKSGELQSNHLMPCVCRWSRGSNYIMRKQLMSRHGSLLFDNITYLRSRLHDVPFRLALFSISAHHPPGSLT